jgi:small subunit ribosomal protein S21
MITVKVRYNDVEFALRTLKKQVQKSGLLKELRQHRYYEKPSDRRRRQKKVNIIKTRKLELDLLGLLGIVEMTVRGGSIGTSYQHDPTIALHGDGVVAVDAAVAKDGIDFIQQI